MGNIQTSLRVVYTVLTVAVPCASLDVFMLAVVLTGSKLSLLVEYIFKGYNDRPDMICGLFLESIEDGEQCISIKGTIFPSCWYCFAFSIVLDVLGYATIKEY